MDHSVYRMMSADRSAAQASLTPGLVGRVWHFARAYRARVAWFLVMVVIGALLGLVPPLVIRAIIDDAVPHDDRRQVTVLAGLLVVVAFVVVTLALVLVGLVILWLVRTR